MPVVQPQGDAPEPPRGAMLRDSDGGASQAPAFLRPTRPVAVAATPPAAAPAAAADDAEAKPKPRRRRAPRSFEGGEGAPATADSED
jgi:hypothetical protein